MSCPAGSVCSSDLRPVSRDGRPLSASPSSRYSKPPRPCAAACCTCSWSRSRCQEWPGTATPVERRKGVERDSRENESRGRAASSRRPRQDRDIGVARSAARCVSSSDSRVGNFINYLYLALAFFSLHSLAPSVSTNSV